MKLLYSNILPLGINEGQETIIDCIHNQMSSSTSVSIAVGYVSRASLEELDSLVSQHNITNITLIIGMYFVEGMPESSYNLAMELNRKWNESGIGEIRIVKPFKYHGKVYSFSNNDGPFSAIIGSANLGAIKLEASNRRQYESASVTYDQVECLEIHELIEQLKMDNCSEVISTITSMPKIREKNTSLNGIDLVAQVPESSLKLYEDHKTVLSFQLPIKVPPFDQRHSTEKKHYTKSNLNVCYAAPRSRRKSRDWFEVQITVGKEIRESEGYPEYKCPFFVVTDDGYWFKAHTTSQNNKQFSAVGDELILGRWLKGRLAAAGLVAPVNDTQLDTDRMGMITQEMLETYGCSRLVLTKTDQSAKDSDGSELEVWFLSFESNETEGN